MKHDQSISDVLASDTLANHIYIGWGVLKVPIHPSFKMSSVTHFSVDVGELTNLALTFILLMTWMAAFGEVSVGADGPTLEY